MRDGWGQVRGRGTDLSQRSWEWGRGSRLRREFQPELEGPDISQLGREGLSAPLPPGLFACWELCGEADTLDFRLPESPYPGWEKPSNVRSGSLLHRPFCHREEIPRGGAGLPEVTQLPARPQGPCSPPASSHTDQSEMSSLGTDQGDMPIHFLHKDLEAREKGHPSPTTA